MQSSDNCIKQALSGNAELLQLPELADPHSLVVLAATALNDLHPELDRMAVLLACYDAERRLINAAVEGRKKTFMEHLESQYGLVDKT